MFGDVKLDMAYGAVIYGLAVGKNDQIIVSGGQYGQNNIDVKYKDAQKVSPFTRILD